MAASREPDYPTVLDWWHRASGEYLAANPAQMQTRRAMLAGVDMVLREALAGAPTVEDQRNVFEFFVCMAAHLTGAAYASAHGPGPICNACLQRATSEIAQKVINAWRYAAADGLGGLPQGRRADA